MSGHLLQQAARQLGLSMNDVVRVVRTAPLRYKVFPIPKRSGGERIIAQPARELKDLQYFLMEHLLSRLPVHTAATAYRQGVSIRHNAEPHAPHSSILKVDFRDFFGSIKSHDFEKHCPMHGIFLDKEDTEFCRQVLFWQERHSGSLQLSIGAPSSPMVSNTIVYQFDNLVADICANTSITYSRYADDLTFSSDNIDALIMVRAELPRLLSQLPYPILYINHDKTVLVTRKYRRTVTGLTLTNDGKVSLGRKKKRNLRAAVYSFAHGLLSDTEIAQLRGQLAYVKSVEPDFLARLERKYGERLVRALMRAPIVRSGQPPNG